MFHCGITEVLVGVHRCRRLTHLFDSLSNLLISFHASFSNRIISWIVFHIS